MPWVWPALLAVVAAVAIAVTRRQRRRIGELAEEAGRLRALAKERAERVSILSHEIRTPLALVKGAGELLVDGAPGPLTDRQRQFLTTITENTQRMIAMAEDLLTDARLEATLFDIHITRTDLRVLVRQTVRELRRVQATEIRLDNRGAPLIVPVDRQLMRQAVNNLVTNAVRHAQGEYVEVRVTAGDASALIAVSDNGTGMSAADRAGLFAPFETGSSPRPGTGLGMLITQRIIDLHGGRVFVDTLTGRGTSIYLSLPLSEDT